MVEEELDRYRCVGDDGSYVTVIDRRHVYLVRNGQGSRRQLGARRLALDTGEAVRYIDSETFEAVETGELLRRLG